MRTDTKALLEKALRLPEADRAELVGELLHSLQPAADAVSEAEVEDAWRREVAARVAELDSGEVETVPWEEIRDQLFARLGERRAG